MAQITAEAENLAFVKAIERALLVEITAAIKVPLMVQAEKLVDEAVASAVAGLKPRIEAWVNERYNLLNVSVLVDRDGQREHLNG